VNLSRQNCEQHDSLSMIYIELVLYIHVSLKAYRLSELTLFVYVKSCQYSMFYTNKMF